MSNIFVIVVWHCCASKKINWNKILPFCDVTNEIVWKSFVNFPVLCYWKKKEFLDTILIKKNISFEWSRIFWRTFLRHWTWRPPRPPGWWSPAPCHTWQGNGNGNDNQLRLDACMLAPAPNEMIECTIYIPANFTWGVQVTSSSSGIWFTLSVFHFFFLCTYFWRIFPWRSMEVICIEIS